MKILIEIGEIKLTGELNSSNTAKLIVEKLPQENRINLWGDEIYFKIPVKTNLEEGYIKNRVNKGDLGYWPQGECFCIFFGPTPISTGDEIIPASEVTIIGKVLDDVSILKKVKAKEKICISQI
jgi:hypothetical protein